MYFIIVSARTNVDGSSYPVNVTTAQDGKTFWNMCAVLGNIMSIVNR